MNWEDARIFLMVARHGQFLSAARKLNVDPATVARRVSALEAQLESRLLDRHTRGVELTRSGQQLVNSLHLVENEFLSVQGLLAAEMPLSGNVRIGAPDGFGTSFLAPRIGQLAEEYPGLLVELVPLPRSFSLSQREADIAVMVGRPQRGQLVAKKLIDYTLRAYASPGYLALYDAPEGLSDLQDHRLIGYVRDLLYEPSLDYTQEISQQWRSTLQIASATGQLEAVRGGAGIGILHDYLAANSSDLVPVLPSFYITRSYWIAWHESLNNEPRVHAIKNFLTRLIAAESEIFCPDF